MSKKEFDKIISQLSTTVNGLDAELKQYSNTPDQNIKHSELMRLGGAKVELCRFRNWFYDNFQPSHT